MKDKSIHLNIGGMTCVNCQNKIKKTLKEHKGITKVRVSYNKASADIVYNEELISRKEIVNIIESLDYYIIKSNKVGKKEVIRISVTLSVIVLLYYILQKTGVLNLLVSSQLADTKMGYGMIFVIGLITSVHCIAMCGGINLSQCIPSNEEVNNKSKLSIFIPSLLYNLGRVVSYTLVGFVIGLIVYILGGGQEVVRNTVKVLSLLLIVCSYFLWSYQGVLFGNKSISNNSNTVDGVQVINSTLNASRYPNITVQVNTPVKWIINAPEGTINGCNNIMIIKEFDIEKKLEVGENIIEFTPTETGVINYSCWMGIVHGTITVTEEEDTSTLTDSTNNTNTTYYSDYKIPNDNLAVAYFNADDNGDQIQEVDVNLTDESFTPAVIVVQKDVPLHWHINNYMTTTTGDTKLLVPFYRANLNIKIRS